KSESRRAEQRTRYSGSLLGASRFTALQQLIEVDPLFFDGRVGRELFFILVLLSRGLRVGGFDFFVGRNEKTGTAVGALPRFSFQARRAIELVAIGAKENEDFSPRCQVLTAPHGRSHRRAAGRHEVRALAHLLGD